MFQHHVSITSQARGVLVVTVHGTEVSSVRGVVQRRSLSVSRGYDRVTSA